MVFSSALKHRLKKFIKEISSHRANHTEFVSVYIPVGYDITKIINQLQDEQGTATNIKSAGTRKNVQAALERMIQHLRIVSKTPPNGLAVFTGNVAAREGRLDVQVWSMEPPVPLNIRLYRCEKTFVTDPLKEIMIDKTVYGLVVMDRRDASIALLKGKAIVPLIKTHSEVPGKFRAGGQSAQRFARIREGAAKDHYKKVGEYMKEQFLGMNELKGIIVGGPGPTKYSFVEGNFITDQVKKKIIAIKDLSYTGDFGLSELVDKSQDVLADEEIAAEKKAVQRFLEGLSTEPNKVAYGEAEVRKALEMNSVDLLLISEGTRDEIIDEFSDKADLGASEMMIISTDTREGSQLKDLSGIAAVLRFPIH